MTRSRPTCSLTRLSSLPLQGRTGRECDPPCEITTVDRRVACLAGKGVAVEAMAPCFTSKGAFCKTCTACGHNTVALTHSLTHATDSAHPSTSERARAPPFPQCLSSRGRRPGDSAPCWIGPMIITPVRYVIYPWIATVTQGRTAYLTGVGAGLAQ